MKSPVAAFVAGALALALSACTTMPSYQAAISDPARPQDDTKRDTDRRPADMLAFAEVQAGDKVVDLIPGGGYFTRIFARAVGPAGTVYAYQPSELDSLYKRPIPILAVAAEPAYTNLKLLHQPIGHFVLPEPADLVWTSQNYHDMFLKFFGPVDVAKLNQEIYAALKPGGLYIVLDHAAENGSGLRDAEKLHRIGQEKVRADLEAAGFVFVAESNVLRNPSDLRTANVFDPGIRGHTDQFILKFRRPR